MATANGPCRMLIKSVCPLFARKRTSLGRTFTMSDEDFVDIHELQAPLALVRAMGRRAKWSARRRALAIIAPPWSSGQTGSPSTCLRLGRTINELHNIHLGHTTVLVESLSLIGARDFRRQ